MTTKKIVLLHGWGASVAKLAPLSSELKKLGWAVYLPKLPGFDLKTPDTPWTLDDYKMYVLAGVRKKWNRSKFVVFGHSFGGRIALKMAMSVNPQVAGIVLCATSGISRPSSLKRYSFWLLAKLGKIFLVVPFMANFWKRVIYKGAREHDYEKAQGTMKITFKNIVEENIKNKISRVKASTLILWGRLDKMTPFADALFLKRVIRKSKLVDYPNQGHKLPYEKPKQLATDINLWYKQLTK